MVNLISWTLVIMAGIFITYWVVTYVLLKSVFSFNVGVKTIEFFRLWLKPLFIINFSWFIAIEFVYSLIYWTSFLLLQVLSFFSPAIRFLNSFMKSDDPAFFTWIIYSVVIYLVVMTPYFILQYKLSFYFKRNIFTKLAPSFNATLSKFRGQTGGSEINQLLYTQLAAKDESIKDWVTKSLEDHASSPGFENKRFSIQMTATDNMTWEINNIKAEFYEGVIDFKGEKKIITRDGKTKYETAIEKELFDGIVICLENILENSWATTVFEVQQPETEKKVKNREIHKQKFLIRLYNDFVLKVILSKSKAETKGSNLAEFVPPEIIQIATNSSIQYLICEKNNMCVLLHTNLENTAFDLNMNIPVKESMELFKQDLSMVHSAMNDIPQILQHLQKNKNH